MSETFGIQIIYMKFLYQSYLCGMTGITEDGVKQFKCEYYIPVLHTSQPVIYP